MAMWKFITVRAVRGYAQDRCSSFAAAIAYYALLSLFPLAVFAVSLGGYFLRNDPSAQERMINALLENLPLSNDAGRQQLNDALAAVTKGRAGLGLLGLLGAAYSASALFGAVRSSLNAVFRVQKARPLIQGKLIDLGLVFGLGILVLLSLALTAAIAIAQKFSQSIFGDYWVLGETLFTLAFFVLPTLVSAAVFLVLYKVVPHVEYGWRGALPGAVLAAIAFEILKIGFSKYVANFGNYDAVYGTLGFVIVFLFFAYLSSQIVLFGAEFTRSYMEVSTGTVPAAPPAIPRRPMSLAERVERMVKALFVAEEPHHEERRPYSPAREGAPLTDEQAKQRDG